MAIPDFQSIFLPFLQILADGANHPLSDIRNDLALRFKLSATELTEKLPSGARVFANRVAWARVYLAKAGLVENPARAVIHITDRGRDLLSTNPSKLDVRALDKFEDFRRWRTQAAKNGPSAEPPVPPTITPLEALDQNYAEIQEALKVDLLQQIRAMSDGQFEDLIVDLLVRLGYTGELGEGLSVGRSGDGGIDGVVKQDRLGLRVIYVQAKRWQNAVGEPQLRDFVGALVKHGAYEGVFATSSAFTDAALEYVKYLDRKVVLINGDMLAELMIELDVGVRSVKAYGVKRVDADYFSPEE